MAAAAARTFFLQAACAHAVAERDLACDRVDVEVGAVNMVVDLVVCIQRMLTLAAIGLHVYLTPRIDPVVQHAPARRKSGCPLNSLTRVRILPGAPSAAVAVEWRR